MVAAASHAVCGLEDTAYLLCMKARAVFVPGTQSSDTLYNVGARGSEWCECLTHVTRPV